VNARTVIRYKIGLSGFIVALLLVVFLPAACQPHASGTPGTHSGIPAEQPAPAEP
jgi:hypothetical protein